MNVEWNTKEHHDLTSHAVDVLVQDDEETEAYLLPGLSSYRG